MRFARSVALGAFAPLLYLSTSALASNFDSAHNARLSDHLSRREGDYYAAGEPAGAHDPSQADGASAYEAPGAGTAEYGPPASAEWSSPAAEGAYTPTSWAAESTPTADWASTSSLTPTPAGSYPSAATGGDGLEGCLATCSASFAWPPPSALTPTPAPVPSPSESYAPDAPAGSGSGVKPVEGGAKTHTVIVAPSQGVLRFVPFALTVKPGDTVKYQWGAGPHTVTKSSLLGICNATTVEPFTSGRLNKSATFEHVVGDNTEPTFVFCGVQPHCTKGMFSILNPPAAPANASTSAFDPWLESMAANSSAVAKMVQQAKTEVGNQTEAWAWGSIMAVDPAMEEWAKMAAIENMLWTRMSFAANPSALVDGFSLASFNSPPSFDELSNGTRNDHSSDSSGYASSAAAGAGPTPAIPGTGAPDPSATVSGEPQTSNAGASVIINTVTSLLALTPLLFVVS